MAPGIHKGPKSNLARWLQAEVRTVLGDERLLVGGHVLFREDGADWTGGHARTAINAFFWVNVKLVVALVDALDRTDINAGGILCADAGLSDDVRHDDRLLCA
jgi:hypothetical protein